MGHGGLAKEIAQYIDDINKVEKRWDLLGYCTSDAGDLGKAVGRHKIMLLDSELRKLDRSVYAVIGVGFPHTIQKIALALADIDMVHYHNVIHPFTYLSDRVDIGSGNVVSPGTIVSVDVCIGNFNILNWNCTIGHDVKMGCYNVFNPGCNISGSCTIGSRVLVGTGAQILQGLSICDDVVIGAGAVVTKDIDEPGTYVGVPARRVK